jgi:hypothetical protein
MGFKIKENFYMEDEKYKKLYFNKIKEKFGVHVVEILDLIMHHKPK